VLREKPNDSEREQRQQRQVRRKLALLWFVGLEKEDSETRE
jgi:hypothetical protein